MMPLPLERELGRRKKKPIVSNTDGLGGGRCVRVGSEQVLAPVQEAHRIEYREARLEDNRLTASNADELGENLNLKGVDRVGKSQSSHPIQMVLGAWKVTVGEIGQVSAR
jgi:hypothetical protein